MTRKRLPSFKIQIPRFKKRKANRPTPGARPGTLVVPPDLPPPLIKRFVYNQGTCETSDVDPRNLATALSVEPGSQVWVDIQGMGDADTIRLVGSELGLHPLTLEDIAHVHQRPKLEEFDGYLLVIARACRLTGDNQIANEQLTFVLKDNLLVTFQERSGDGFDPVRRRLKEGKGPIRQRCADYLLYALADTIIDNYFPVLERYGDIMDQLDDEMRRDPTPDLASGVHTMRRELRQLRRAVWPLRDVLSTLGRSDLAKIDDVLMPAFRDCYDHVVQVADFVEGSRERASDLADLYQTMISEKSNQVMKVLTIIATVFIPLTFLCGLYGMNFDPEVSRFNMPELKWRYGYPAFWLVMLMTFMGMMWFFRRKGWIGKVNYPPS